MKKMLKSLMAAIGVALLMTGSVFAATTVTIGDVEALKAFAVAVNGGKSYEGDTVTLSADLDLTGVEWTPIGVGTRSSKSYTGKAFKGTFDGGNHTISGLTITSTASADAAVGLFGVVDGGTVKNLKLDAVNINVASSDLAGGAIGLMVNNAKAENITVGGSIVGNDGVGGIVGRLIISGTISSCTNNASVTSSYGGIGGIVGKAYYEDGANTALFASVDKCVNNGTITAPMYVGGIVGLARANVTGCINNGVVVGGTQTGGIVGQLIAAGTVSNNENNAKISGKNHLGGIIGDYSQTPAYTYYNVTIANNINRGELAATEQRAAILGCNNIDGFTAMTASGNVSFYNAEGLELFGNPEDMVIDSTNMFNPAMTLSDFVQKVVAGNGVFDGNGATVQITPVSGDARTETKEGLPDRLQKYTNPEVYYAQYQRFGNLTDVSISNVKFVFVPAPVTVVDAWNTAGATTTADNINGELQLLNAGNVTFINCSFEKISVSPINATAVSVSGCSFNGLDAYAIKDIKASTVTVADTTFADCNGGFWMNAAPAVLSVIGNTFANVGRRGAIQFSANGDYSSTEMTVTGNNVTGGAFLWQLNPTVTYEQVSAILDTAKNTYGTAYVSGSTEPKPPVARIGDVTYATLEAAFAAATEGQTITLLQDATPALTSQRAITKAAVIDLGGKTLTLTEDDLYFGTTTFQNGNIVVDSSVKPSTAVFWMFANQTLTFDNVKVVATGVTGTYLIGLDGNNSDLNLLNGSEILVENTTALDLDIICVNASTGNDIVIDNSKINVTNLDGRVLFRGNYTIKGNSEINLEGITKAGIRIEAGQTLSIEDTASVTITGEPRDGGIHLTDVTATYTKADTATVSATVNRPAIAKIGDTPYYTLADAVAAAQASDEIVLLADATVEGTLALPAGIKLTSNGKTINGSIRMLGDLELNGPLTITGGLWVGTTDGHLTATLSGDKLTASYFVFQRGTYTIDADIDAVYGYLSFEATFEVNSTIHTTGSNGEVLYINGNVTLNDGAVLDSDNSVFVCNDNAVLTLKPGSTVDSNVKITTSGAKVNVDATGMTAGATANITGTVTNSGNGTVAIVNSDMFVAQIVNGKIVLVGYVAKIGEQKYTSLQSAIEAVQNGETVALLADVDVTTPAYVQNALNHARNVNFTLDLNGKTLTANTGNSVFRFNIANSGATSDVAITIKNGKVVAGASTWCALMASGISADVKAVMNLEDLTVEASKAGDLAIKAWANGVVNASNVTVNATNAAGGFYAVGGEIVLNDCTVNQKGLHTAPYLSMAFAVSDSGKMTVNSGTYSAEPTAAAEGYNQGTTHGSWVGGVMNSGGTLIINGGTFSNGNFGEDSLATAARGLIFGDTASNIRINGGTFNALKSVIDYQNNLGVQPNPNIVIAGGTFSADPTVVTSYGGVEIAEGYVVTKNNGVWTVAKAVAKIGAGYYTNLVDAFKAATEGCTIEILSDVTIDYKWDCRDYATGGSHSQFKESVTINGNGHTLKFTGTVNDSNWNTIFRFEENATVNNLTVDISEATGAQRVISAKKSLTVDGLTVVGSAKYGIIFGEGASAADLAAAEIVVKNSTLTGTRRAISDNEGGKDVKSVAITDNTLNANVYASASESITFNNNTAAGEVDLRSYTAENVLSVEAKGNTLNAGVKNYIYAKNIDAQEGFTAERVPTTVSTYEQLIAALAEDNAYVVLANDITATATQSSGYGKAGIVVEAGDVLDGNDKTLTINGANATWDCAIAMRGGEVKNLTIAGAMRGVFMPGANSDVVIDNCKFQDVIYTFNSDDGSKDYTVTIKNTELNGWTSFSDVHKAVVFDTCTFAKGNGYAYCRPYQATTFKDCSFSGDFEIDCSRVADNKLAFNGCTYNGQAITSENAFDLFGDGAKVLVNGAPADYTKVAQVGDNYYTSINAALAAAQNDAVVELLWAEGNAPIAMNGSVYGKSVTITGTATVDWSKGFLFVGRGGEGNGTVIFDNANLASASNNASTGIHVSGREKNTNNKYDGTVVINNSTIVLDYLIDKGAMTMTNSTLTVKNGFAVGGRPASETESGVDATATFDLTNGSTLIVNNHNGMGLGYEAIGVMTIDSTSTFECTQSFLVTGKGALNVAKGGKVEFTGAVKTLTVNGALASAGDVSADIVAGENADIEISGGVYTQDVNEWCVEGCAALPNLNDEYVVGVKPTATVNNLGAMTIPANEYYIYNGSLTTGTEPMPLNFVMQFVADQKAEDMAESPFAQWFADFVITFEGIEGDSFDPSGCYLAGYYGSTDSWDGLWVKIPVDGLLTKVDEGVRYPVMLGVGMGQTYDYICSGVQAFSCAMYIPDDILAANPNLKVKLELNVVDSSKGADSAANALVAGENIFKASETEYTAEDFIDVELPEVEVVDIKNTLTDSDPDLTFALNFKIKDMENLTEEYLEKLFAKYGNYYTDYVLTISGLSQESVTFNANGDADGYLAGQYDAWSQNWVSVPFDDVIVENGQSLYIMEYAAKLMGQQGLRFTLAEVAEIVQNFDCGVYFTPEFLAANPDLKVDLELKVFTEDQNGNKINDISVATKTFDKDDFGVAAVVAEGKQTKYFATLAEAFTDVENGETVMILAPGTYALTTSGKNITVTGAVDGVVFDNIGKKNMGGANVTFNNVTFDYYPNVDYTGLQHSGDLVYNNCTFDGQVFLYGASETFNNCTFNQNSANAYNVWTYTADVVNFNECTFNSAGKSVLVYNENSAEFNTVNVAKCEFIASASVDGKAAIEMDSSLTAGINLTIDASTTATGFGSGNVSGNSLWNNKKGNSTDANNDITVVVNGETVLAPVTFVAKIGNVGYITLQAAVDAAKNGETVDLLAACVENVTVAQNPDIAFTIEGNGNEMTGTITVDGKSSAYPAAGLTIKNIAFDATEITKDASVNLGGSNNTRYTSNVTVLDCSFVDLNSDKDKAAVKNYTGGCKNLTVSGCSAQGMHSLIQVKGVAGITVSDIEIAECKNGISVGTSTGVTIARADIDVDGYGFRADGSGAYDAIVEDCKITAELPVVIRKNTADGYALTLNGENELNGTNGNAYAVVFTNGDDGTYEIPAGNFIYANNGNEVKVYPVSAYVAEVGGKKYVELEEALKALSDGATLKLLADIEIDGTWDCRNNGAKITANNVKINGNGKTIKLTGTVDDKNWNTVFRFEGKGVWVQNLTLDVSEAKGVQRGITAKFDIAVIQSTFIGNGTTSKYGLIFGEGAGNEIGGLEINVIASTFKDWTYGVADNRNGQDVRYINMDANVFDNANVIVSASKTVYFDNNKMDGGYVNISSYTVPNDLSVRALNSKVDADFAGQNRIVADRIANAYGFLTPVAEDEKGKLYLFLDEAINAGSVITIRDNINTDSAFVVNKQIAIDLNGKTIATTENDKSGDGVFRVVDGGDLTIEDGSADKAGTINGVGGNNYNIAVWADGGKVTINGGNFTNVGATDENGNNHFDLIYAKNGGEVVINDGKFVCESPAWTLNIHDGSRQDSSITVNGGTFVGFDPRNNAAETAGTTFMGEGKYTFAEGGNYIVVTPEDYILNDVSSDSATVNEIDSLLAGAVTVTKDGEKYVATATYTFKVTAVDTVNPEKSEYELTGGTLRPGKSVKVKYIDLVTGTESWDKPEADTVTFKLVIK